jgi:uncharacterized membrane protein YheB (UPF0754 family)
MRYFPCFFLLFVIFCKEESKVIREDMEVLDEIIYVFSMGVIGAVIGWITNVVAIRLLFRPYVKYRVPFFGWQIQGLIPKKQKDIALGLGEVVSTELITGNDLMASLSRKDIQARVRQKVESYVREQVFMRLPFVIPGVIQASMAEYVSRALGNEVEKLLQHPEGFFGEDELEDVRQEIKKIVAENVMALEMAKLEELVYFLARTELKHIELLGGVLGFMIGLVQGVVSLLAL